jgi:hypothetical protein
MCKNSTPERERAQVYRRDHKMVGGITGDVFHKTVQASKHFLHTPPAIAFDLDVIAQAREQGARIAEVRDSESGRVYRAEIARIWSKGFPVNRGHGEQIALALNEWNRGDEPTVNQLPLFGA